MLQSETNAGNTQLLECTCPKEHFFLTFSHLQLTRCSQQMSAETDILGKSFALNLASLEKHHVLPACEALQQTLGFSTLAKILSCGIMAIRAQLTREELDKVRKEINKSKKSRKQKLPKSQPSPKPKPPTNLQKTKPILFQPFRDPPQGIPTELISKLFNYLEHKSHVSFANVSKKMFIISRNPSSLLKFGLPFEGTFYDAMPRPRNVLISLKLSKCLSPNSSLDAIISRCHNFKKLTHLAVAGDYEQGVNSSFSLKKVERETFAKVVYGLLASSQKTLEAMVIHESVWDPSRPYQSIVSPDLKPFQKLNRLR